MASPLGNLRSVALRRVLFEPSVKARSILALSSSQSVQNNNLMRKQKSYVSISLKEQRLIKGEVVRTVCSSVHRCLCFCYDLLFFERGAQEQARSDHKNICLTPRPLPYIRAFSLRELVHDETGTNWLQFSMSLRVHRSRYNIVNELTSASCAPAFELSLQHAFYGDTRREFSFFL